MFRRIFRIQTYPVVSIIPLYDYRDPYDDTEPKLIKLPETGWERVKALFQRGENGYVSQEYIATVQITGISFVSATMIAFGTGMTNSFDNFITTNQHTKFISTYEARRKLQDYVIFEGLKKGLKYGTKCCIFTFITGIGSIMIAAYRGEDGILEYTLGAGIAGAVARLYLGLKATAVGFGLGAFLGTIIGTFIWGLGKLSGTTIKDAHKKLFDGRVSRDRQFSDLMKASQESSYTSPSLKAWLKNGMREPEHNLSDEDKRYVIELPITDDKSNENAVKTPVTVNSVEKLESSN